MINKSFLLVLVLITTAAELGLTQESRRLPTNKELVSKAQSVYVQSDTFYMKRENLESSLLGRAEFKAWDLQITGKPQLADLLIRVRRVPFTNHFTYTVSDRATDTIVMAGKVDSLAGTVYGLVVAELVHTIKAVRVDPLTKPHIVAQTP